MSYFGNAKVFIHPFDCGVDNEKEGNFFNIKLSEKNIGKYGLGRFDGNGKYVKNKQTVVTENKYILSCNNDIEKILSTINQKYVTIFLLPGKYYVRLNEIIKGDSVCIIGIVDGNNYPELIFSGFTLIGCQSITIKNVKITTSEGLEIKNFHNEKLFSSGAMIFSSQCENIRISDCIFSDVPVQLFCIKSDNKCNNIVIKKNSFNKCYSISFSNCNNVVIKDNQINNMKIDYYFANGLINNNNFIGNCVIKSFNSNNLSIISNEFNEFETPHCNFNFDHNSYVYFICNKIRFLSLDSLSLKLVDDGDNSKKVNQNPFIFGVDRYSKCYLNNNIFYNYIESLLMANVEFEGKLILDKNGFDKKEIEIAIYDAKFKDNKNNYLLSETDEKINFLLTERGIIKPTRTVYCAGLI